MKQNPKYLATYLPWLLVLLAFDLFTAVLLWLSDVEKVSSPHHSLSLATVLLFSSYLLLIRKERKNPLPIKPS